MGGFLLAERMMKKHQIEMTYFYNLLLLGAVFTIPIFVIGMILPMDKTMMMLLMQPIAPNSGVSLMALLLLILSTPVQFWVGRSFHVKAFKSIVSGSLGMDFLISSG